MKLEILNAVDVKMEKNQNQMPVVVYLLSISKRKAKNGISENIGENAIVSRVVLRKKKMF